jgi:hypothetical protein
VAWQGLLGPCEVVDGPACDIPDPPESDDEGDDFWGVQGTAGRYLSVDASWMTPELVDYPALWSVLAQENSVEDLHKQKLPDNLHLTLMLVRESDGKVATIIKDLNQSYTDGTPLTMLYRFVGCGSDGHFDCDVLSMIMRTSHTKILNVSFGVRFDCPEFAYDRDDIENYVSSIHWQDVDDPPF